MTPDQTFAALANAGIAWFVALALATAQLRSPPAWALRTNYAGRAVPVAGGAPIAAGSFVALAITTVAAAAGWSGARIADPGVALVVVVLVMYLAGAWDDRRGDERPRGFRGHLAAGRTGRVTGGIVKLVAGAGCGMFAGALLAETVADAAAIALIVALTANLVNLTDRAPGRAGKVTLALALGAAAGAPGEWVVAAAAPLGALVALLPADLDERLMLGDAGANPLGAAAGLGLALALPTPGKWAAVALLAALNAASERWSFSEVIGRVRPLRAFDRWGRKEHE